MQPGAGLLVLVAQEVDDSALTALIEPIFGVLVMVAFEIHYAKIVCTTTVFRVY